MKRFKVLKIGLSFWIILHVVILLILPNSSSYFGRHLPVWALSYGNALGLHYNWNFFSPDPAHTMYFRYRVYYPEDPSGVEVEPEEGFLPSFQKQRVMSVLKRRELYEMRFMVLDTKRIRKFLAPWLCRSHPRAREIHIDHIIEAIPNLDVAARSTATIEDLTKTIEYVSYDFSCEGGTDELAF